MNPHEAKKLGLLDKPMGYWPKWAQRDFKLSCEAMASVREDALSENIEGERG